MGDLVKDLRYGTRSLLKRPGFTMVAVITLALGIGANTTIFSIINALVLSPPRITDPERVVAVWKTPKDKRTEGFVSYLDLQDWRTRNQSFEDIAAYKPNGFNLVNGDEVERIQGMRVTANFFPLVRAKLYLPYQQNSWTWGNFLVRTTVEPTTLAQSFREQVRAGEKSVPLTDVRALTEAISETVAQPRFYTFLFGIFGAIGLVLTVTGVYGLVSYTVAQRTQEIGIRMALGASRQSVVRMVVKQGIALAVIGVAIGIAVSFVLARVIATLLFDVKPTDLVTFSVATVVLLGAAILASYVPARRATKVDPLVALRYE